MEDYLCLPFLLLIILWFSGCEEWETARENCWRVVSLSQISHRSVVMYVPSPRFTSQTFLRYICSYDFSAFGEKTNTDSAVYKIMCKGINVALWRTAICIKEELVVGTTGGERLREREDICSTCVEGGYGGWWVGGFKRHHEMNPSRSKEQLLAPSAQERLPSSLVLLRGSQGDVVYLGWPIAPSSMSPIAGSQPMSTAFHLEPK